MNKIEMNEFMCMGWCFIATQARSVDWFLMELGAFVAAVLCFLSAVAIASESRSKS